MSNSYYRVCTKLNDKGHFISEGDDIEQYKKGEAYISAFKYNDSHKKLFDEKGTVAGITDVTGDIIFFDFDNVDIEQARQDTLETISRLKKFGITEKEIKVHFSGRKGFNLSIHTDTEFTPKEAKNLATKLAGDLDSFDSSIYNANRIIRIEGSLHKGSGLRKTAISFSELKDSSIHDIQGIAGGEYEYEKPKKITPSKEFVELTEDIKLERSNDYSEAEDRVDYFSNPLKLQPWKLAISQGFFPNGQRSNALLILGATLKNKGYDKSDNYFALKSASEKQSKRYGEEKFNKEEIWHTIIEQVYSPTWNNGSFSEDNFSTALQHYFEDMGVPRKEESDLVDDKFKPTKLADVGDIFEDFVKNYEKNVIKTGIDEIDRDMPFTPGTNIGIIGAPGSGKTSIALKVLQYCSENDIHCILGSIDMTSTRLYEKVLYRVSGLSRESLYQKIRDGEAEEIKEKVKELFKTVYIYDKSAASVEDIARYHRTIEKRDGVEIKMTMVDYFERLHSDVADDTASSKKVASQWQDYITDTNVAGIMFVQPNKISLSGGPNCPILDYRAIKGSSFLYQSFRGIISLWRPFYTPKTAEHDKYMQMALLKNDLGELNTYDFGWDGKRGEIFPLDDDEKRVLNLMLDTDPSDEDPY